MKENNDLELDNYRSYRKENTSKLFSTSFSFPSGSFYSYKGWTQFDNDIINNLFLKLKVEWIDSDNPENFILNKLNESVTYHKPMIFYFWTPHQVFYLIFKNYLYNLI